VLHLAHPLVRAAVEHARRGADAQLRVRFRLEPAAASIAPPAPAAPTGSTAASGPAGPTAGGAPVAPAGSESVTAAAAADGMPAALREARGRRGRLAITRLRFEGVEPVERLVVTALIEGRETPLTAAEAAALLELPASDIGPFATPVAVDDAALEDAVEESLFVERVQLAREERERFARKLHQLGRSLEDQVLVLRQRRRAAAQRLERAREERDAASGMSQRRRAEQEMAAAQERIEEIDAELVRLAERRDDRYSSTRDRTLARRYAPLAVERLLAAEFVLE
jgi:hypothetical protein